MGAYMGAGTHAPDRKVYIGPSCVNTFKEGDINVPFDFIMNRIRAPSDAGKRH